jgi:uncharacterized OB-fold protein
MDMTTEPRPLTDLRAVPVIRPATGGDPARLIGSRCRSCDARSFPTRTICFECLGDDLEEILLGPDGTLYSFSTVHVSASRRVPYTIGYVDLAEGPRVLARLAGDPARYTPDDRVTLAVADDGDWSFMSVREEGAGV